MKRANFRSWQQKMMMHSDLLARHNMTIFIC